MNEDGGRVIGLEARNIMQLRALEIRLEGQNLVIISGENEAGKSTVLDLLSLVTGGAALCPEEPIRRGEREGFAAVEMVGYTARRDFWLTKGGNLASKLTLKSKEGAEFKSPQTMLDKILGALTIDPLEFIRKIEKEPKKARDMLLQLAGIEIDLEGMARARQEIYYERTRVNKNIKNKVGELAGIAIPNPGLLVDEVSLTGLLSEHSAATKTTAKNKQKRDYLAKLNNELDDITLEINRLGYLRAEKTNEGKILSADVSKLVDPDPAAIALQLAEAEETNREIREAKGLQSKRTTLGMIIESLDDDSHHLTHRIDNLDAQKTGALQGAKFPIDGLGVDETGIRFKGLPLAQASQSQKIKVGMAISSKMNPKASLIRIYEGSLLDSNSMKIVDEFARENKLCVLVEVVDETGNVGIVIEDGVVAKVN